MREKKLKYQKNSKILRNKKIQNFKKKIEISEKIQNFNAKSNYITKKKINEPSGTKRMTEKLELLLFLAS